MRQVANSSCLVPSAMESMETGDADRDLNDTQSGAYVLTIYAPVIYTRPCIMFWRRGYTLRGEVGGGWALEFLSFLGPMKW
jgi:hypothetical protein